MAAIFDISPPQHNKRCLKLPPPATRDSYNAGARRRELGEAFDVGTPYNMEFKTNVLFYLFPSLDIPL